MVAGNGPVKRPLVQHVRSIRFNGLTGFPGSVCIKTTKYILLCKYLYSVLPRLSMFTDIPRPALNFLYSDLPTQRANPLGCLRIAKRHTFWPLSISIPHARTTSELRSEWISQYEVRSSTLDPLCLKNIDRKASPRMRHFGHENRHSPIHTAFTVKLIEILLMSRDHGNNTDPQSISTDAHIPGGHSQSTSGFMHGLSRMVEFHHLLGKFFCLHDRQFPVNYPMGTNRLLSWGQVMQPLPLNEFFWGSIFMQDSGNGSKHPCILPGSCSHGTTGLKRKK